MKTYPRPLSVCLICGETLRVGQDVVGYVVDLADLSAAGLAHSRCVDARRKSLETSPAAPHDAELIEADAAYMWSTLIEPGPGMTWAGLANSTRDKFRRLAADPYRNPGFPTFPPRPRPKP